MVYFPYADEFVAAKKGINAKSAFARREGTG